MADLDELQIKITSSSKEAEEAISKLVSGLENLDRAISKIDTAKINSFANAMSKLANIGSNTNTTNKALKSMADEISNSFGIRTKKGIEEVTVALQALYNASRNVKLNNSIENDNVFQNSIKNLQEAIETHYKYRQAVDETSKAIAEYVRQQNKSGQKIAMADMAKEYGENFKEVSKVLGSSFKNQLKSTEGATDLVKFFEDMNATLGTTFKTGNDQELKQSLDDLVAILSNAKDKVYDFSDAVRSGLLSGEEAADAAYDIVDRLFALIKEQDKYGASTGLGGLTQAFKDISNIPMPDMTGVAEAVRAVEKASPQRVAKEISEIGDAASKAATQVDELGRKLILGDGFTMKDFPTNFTMKDVEPVKNVEFPPAVIQEAEIIQDKLLPAIINTEDAVQNLYGSMSNTSSVESAYDALYQKFVDMQMAMKELVHSPMTFAEPHWDKEGNYHSADVTAWQAVVDKTSGGDYFYQVQEAAEKCLPAIREVGSTALATVEQIKELDNSVDVIDADSFKNVVKQTDEAGDAAKHASDKIKSVSLAEVIEQFVALSEALERLSRKFGELAEKGIKLFEVLISPLKLATEEYVEKFEGMKKSVESFVKHVQAKMNKLAQFWKRTMKTFTFMLVRKAITAIIKEVGNAVQSLAMYSNAMGTAFNTDISNMIADFQYLGRSIVSVFAPLLNYIAPIIDAIVDRIATLLSYIGMLIAALGGSSSFTKAKKNVTNYAESLDSASKSAKNLTMGIDELNIINDNKSGGSAKPYDGWEDAWEQVQIPEWILNLSDLFKDFWEKFLAPLKAAWEKVKARFLSAINYFKTQILALISSIGSAFMRVWNQAKTIKLFENILNILADIMIIIGALAQQFRKAWDEADRGVRIFEGLRNILLIISQHLVNITDYMVSWASQIDFAPLLDGVIDALAGIGKAVDFLGGVFEDVMRLVVLKYIKWLIEEGLPHLLHTIDEIIQSFNFEKIQNDLVPLEKAFERLLENLDIGKTNAIGNLGKQIAEFTNGEEFTKFIQRIADIIDLISAEDVEKVLTGIGQGILAIADALVKFVNSDSFMAFLEDIDKWLENATSEDIAGLLEKLAWAIGLFKFAEFASAGLAGFFEFATVIKGMQNIGTIATQLTNLSAGLVETGTAGAIAGAGSTTAAGGLTALASPAVIVAAVIAAVVVAVYSLIESFGGLDGLIMRIREGFERVTEKVKKFATAIGFDKAVENLKEAFSRLLEKLGGLHDVWDLLLRAVEWLVTLFISSLLPYLTLVADGFTIIIDIVATLVDVLGGVGEVIMGVFTLDTEKITAGAKRIGDAIVEGAKTSVGHIGDMFKNETAEELEKGIAGVPEEVKPEVEKAYTTISGYYDDSIRTHATMTAETMKEATKEATNLGLEGVKDADYDSAASATSSNLLDSIKNMFSNENYSEVGNIVNSNIGDSLKSQQKPFTDANEETAQEGAKTLAESYSEWLNSNGTLGDDLGQYGRESGVQITQGLNESIKTGMVEVKTTFANTLKDILRGKDIDVVGAIASLFATISIAIQTNMMALGSTIQSSVLPTFMQTYIFPFFNVDMWQPLFDNLLNMVFIPMFEQFKTWFSESMTTWWEEDLLIWFEDTKWEEDIFTPLKEIIQDHWDNFSSWWDTTMNEWWENQVKPWFDKELWKEQLTHILDVVQEVFDLIRDAIKERMNEAAEAVAEACSGMIESIEEVMTAIDSMLEKLSDFEGFSGDVTFSFGADAYASGGFPSRGSLFWASESGAGAEMVGTIGGKTGVVSNGEITGIADAVYATGNEESQLLAQLISIGQQMLSKDPVVISDKDIARMNISGQNKLGMSIIS